MTQERCYGCMEPKTGPICPHCGWQEGTQNPHHQLPAGTLLRGQYLVGKVLGQGGFGITYLGYDQYLQIPVAIKEYYPAGAVTRDCQYSLAVTNVETMSAEDFERNRQRFLREAQNLAKLEDIPQVVRVRSYFAENETAYIIMEYLRGDTLKDMLKAQDIMSVQQALTIFRPVMEGLRRVHAAGIVHRDISPDNIMRLEDGRIKLLDFGAGRKYKGPIHTTQAILKPGFAPVEQYQTKSELGPWTDIYALSATMYYCMTGQLPPDAPERMLEGTAPDWTLAVGLTPQQQQTLEKAMALRSQDRVQSVDQLIEGIYGPDTQTPGSVPVEVVPRSAARGNRDARKKESKKGGSTGGKHWPVVAAVAALLCAGGLLMAGLLPESPSEPTENIQIFTPTEQPSQEATEPVQEAQTAQQYPVMKAHTGNPNGVANRGTYAFGTNVRRDEVRSIAFLDSLDAAPADAVDYSEAQDGSVQVWTESCGNGFYDVYIAGDGGVAAPEDCTHFFGCFTNLETVSFANAFRTENVTDMSLMFYECKRLKSLDLSSFDTGNVTDMSQMFSCCMFLSEIDLSDFDTGNVTNMYEMFLTCNRLSEIDISSFDTSKVTDVTRMFGNSPVRAIEGNFDWSSLQKYTGFMVYGNGTINAVRWQDALEAANNP